MKQSKVHPFVLFVSAIALLLVAPSTFALFTWSDQDLVVVPSPPSGITIPDAPSTDLDDDGQIEVIVLRKDGVEILNQGQTVWTSPQEWQVVQAEITDLNRDNKPEVALLIWREFSPWPIDAYIPHPGRIQDFHNRENRSCHLILIAYRRGAYREIWAGSALADPLLAFTPADLDHDGRQELIALETHYDANFLGLSSLTVWEWNGFGFTLLSRSPQGYFHSISTVQSSTGQDLLLTQGIFRR